MQRNGAMLAEHDGIGSVMICAHGCVHVRLGFTTLTLTEEQYVQLVAMLTDSASAYELFRHRAAEAADDDGPDAS